MEYALLGFVAKFISPVSQIYFLLCEIDTSPYCYLANLPNPLHLTDCQFTPHMTLLILIVRK